jgi:hypothetical protein
MGKIGIVLVTVLAFLGIFFAKYFHNWAYPTTHAMILSGIITSLLMIFFFKQYPQSNWFLPKIVCLTMALHLSLALAYAFLTIRVLHLYSNS